MKNVNISELFSLNSLLQALEAADVPFSVSDADADDIPLIYVNTAFTNLTGYTAEDVIGKNCRFMQGDQDQPEARRKIREALSNGQPCDVELINYTKDGQEFINRLHIQPLKEDGKIRYYLGFQKKGYKPSSFFG